jgi:glyoxylase-like metal-dependent hydrolase (beta-lactamase superfamily II)
MHTSSRISVAAVTAAALLSCARAPVKAEPTSSAERLFVLNCGEGVAGDISRWSPGVNVGQSMPFADNCYLVQHARGSLLWDTGVPDAVAAMPDGLKPADPRATLWRRPRTLAAQLQQIGVAPNAVTFLAVSHTHPDHVGNVELFPRVPVLVQRAEYEWAFQQPKKPFDAGHPVQLLDGDLDVFGDGSVRILSTPGHTPGHQSLLVHLRETGWVLLSGDAVHFQSNWDARRVPSINANADQTRASMERIGGLLAEHHAQLWINHDQAQTNQLRHAPEAYR